MFMFAELFHGQTAAFKDMALSLLPYLMTLSLKQLKSEREVMILAATSGDTGKAALEGFKDVEELVSKYSIHWMGYLRFNNNRWSVKQEKMLR